MEKEWLNVQIGGSQRKDFPLIPGLTSLLVIDIQDHVSSNDNDSLQPEDYDHESKYLFETSLPQTIPHIAELVRTMREIRDGQGNEDSAESVGEGHGCEVVFTYLQSLTPDCRDISLDYKLSGPKLSSTLPHPGKMASFSTLPAELHPSHSNKGDILVPKTSCSVFQSTNLHYILTNLKIQQLLICGQLTDQCVMSAVRDAADLGYFVTVVEDACAALSVEDHKRGLLGMKGFARIISTRQALYELAIIRGSNAKTFEDEIGDDDANESALIKGVKLDEQTVEPVESSLSIIKPSEWISSLENNFGGAVSALVQALCFAEVKFLRFASVDVVNNIRTKAIPIKRIHHILENSISSAAEILGTQVSIAKVCMAALPSYGDIMIPETNIDARDVLMIRPDLASMRILPYAKESAMVFGTLHDQRTGELSSLCTRGLLNRVIETARQATGIGFSVGAELEFCLVKSASSKHNIVPIDNSTFAGTATLDEQNEFIAELFGYLENQNIDVEMVHAESAPGQFEVVLCYQTDVIRLADNVVLAKETIKACAKKYGMDAMFQPKIYRDQAGNGMHIHLSLRSEKSDDPKNNIFPGSSPFTMSGTAESFLEGILSHLKSLVSFTLPTTQSFDRVGPGCWTGHRVGWDVEEKESPLRVCIDAISRNFTNVEFKSMDNTCNIYLALASVLWAGYSGIVLGMKLRPAMSSNVGDEKLPETLEESLEFLVQDQVLLDLIGNELGKSYIAVKKAEIAHALET